MSLSFEIQGLKSFTRINAEEKSFSWIFSLGNNKARFHEYHRSRCDCRLFDASRFLEMRYVNLLSFFLIISAEAITEKKSRK